MSHYDCKECDASPHENHAPSCSKNPIPEWALKEAVARLNAEGAYVTYAYPQDAALFVTRAVARLIAKYKEPPVDPDVEAFKRVLARGGLYAYTPPMLAQFKKEIAAAKERG